MKLARGIVWGLLGGILILAMIAICYDWTLILENLEKIVDLLKEIVPVFGIVLGVLYTYPIFKQKLLEGHIIKHFDKIQDANRKIRSEALNLMDKYMPKVDDQNPVKKEKIEECINDIQHLKGVAIDGNSESLQYIQMFYDSLVCLKNSDTAIKNYTLYCFLRIHLEEIYNLSGHIYNLSLLPKLKTQKRIIKKLHTYLVNNTSYKINGLNHSLTVLKGSVEFLLFVHNTLKVAEKNKMDDNYLTYTACYKSISDPAALVRLMYNKGIYIPSQLKYDNPLLQNQELSLIGFSANNNTHEGSFCHVYYANIAYFRTPPNIDKETIAKMPDAYLGKVIFSGVVDIKNISIMDKKSHVIQITINTDVLKQYFKKNKKLIKRKMRDEVGKTALFKKIKKK